MTTGTATTKIVIVGGEKFHVSIDADNEAIRRQLLDQGFADVASATIKTGTLTIGEVEHPTIEFVKRAGTKGLDGADLAALLGRVPAIGNSTRQPDLLMRLVSGGLTVAEALVDGAGPIQDALQCDDDEVYQAHSKGAELCNSIDELPAVAAPCAW
jgi:hypothetical protein